jgi:hypothetical protein
MNLTPEDMKPLARARAICPAPMNPILYGRVDGDFDGVVIVEFFQKTAKNSE